MRYVATASPAFVRRHFAQGVGAASLARAPSLRFNAKDELQSRWAQRLCHRHVELPQHQLPSAQAFVTAALAGMGWGLQPLALVAGHLKDGTWNWCRARRWTCRCTGSTRAPRRPWSTRWATRC